MEGMTGMTAASFSIVPRSIVGTGDPMDIIMMIPLVHSWHPARGCVVVQDEGEPECQEPVTRIVIVDHTDPPDVFTGDGWKNGLAFCEPHFRAVRGTPA